ncbi:McrC family protein [Alkaliphilus transvaalensis]|uniref:McrC family protein n=1 Tax=Alkaliphilus transvaalensis TaxID=114628 RepID=UPI0006843DE5|nr:McrC family protein [Alkaliphilus transvaalensis]
MKSKTYCIKEHSYFASDQYVSHVTGENILLPHKLFLNLEEFILQNKVDYSDTIDEFMVTGYAKNAGKVLKAKNYVGVIKTSDNSTIEILPKIFMSDQDDSYSKTKKIFLKMLRYSDDLPVKTFNQANLQATNMNIFDIFIMMFLDELVQVIRQGLKSSYLDQESNLNVFKGKLLVNKHVIKNTVNKHKFYVGYEEFSVNRPENRIIKSTLVLLKKRTTNKLLHKRLNEYLLSFREVDVSINYAQDFNKCISNRLMTHYDAILRWCKIFLHDKSFVNYKGQDVAYSLLFPMEKVFEKYIQKSIMKSNLFRDCTIWPQHAQYYLIESSKRFKLKPDLVIKTNNRTIVLDTKWKILNNQHKDYGIAQSDLYQMYAYIKKYNAQKVILIYPKPNNIAGNSHNYFEKGKDLVIFFIDLENINSSLKSLHCIINEESY